MTSLRATKKATLPPILLSMAAWLFPLKWEKPFRFYSANVAIYAGDGSLGWVEQAPYDRILVTAASPALPTRLLHQLTAGGIMIVPVGTRERQELLCIRRTPGQPEIHNLGGCLFVPLVGEERWESP